MSNRQVNFTVMINDNGTFREVTVDAKELEGAIGQVGQASSSASKGVGMLGSSLGKYLTIGTVVAGLKKGIDKIAEFERANSELASVLGTSYDSIQALTQSAADLGRTTEFTSSQVTSLQTSLARLGFVEDQIMNMQEPVMKFAAAVGTDLASAADFAGSALRAFGLNSKDTGDLLDIMAKSTSASALSFSKLQTSIPIVGPVANAFGLKVSEVVSLLGVLSNAGFDATSAATALRNILLNLADSNGKLAKGLGHTANTMPEIIDALKELRDRGVDLNSALEMTDKRSVAAFESFLDGADSVEKLDKQLKNANGSLDEMYETMTSNVIGAAREVTSAWEGFTLAFQNSRGPIRSVLLEIAEGINAITDAINAAENGGKSHSQKKADQSLLDRFTSIGKNTGRDEMIRQYNAWVNDAEAAYDRAIDAYNAHKTAKNKKAMNEAGNVVMGLADIKSKVMAFGLEDVESITVPDPLEEAASGADESASSISKDIARYRDAVKNAISINAVFKGGVGESAAELKTMQSGLSALISKYGAENAAIKELITEYTKLKAERLGMNTPLEKVSVPELTLGTNAGIGSAISEYHRQVERAVKMNSIFSGSGSKLQTRLSAMKSGITDLIEKYGLYNLEIQKLIEEYKLLSRVEVKATNDSKAVSQTTSKAGEAIGAISTVFVNLGQVIGDTAGSWTQWAGNLMSAVAQAVPAIVTLTAAISAKTKAETADAVAGAASSVAAVPLAGPGLAIAASATILAAILGAIASIPKFAAGGIAYGPTLGLFGEYSGASTNPEVVAPLDKLRDLLGTGNDNPAKTVKFHIEARDLVAVMEKEMQRNKRVG